MGSVQTGRRKGYKRIQPHCDHRGTEKKGEAIGIVDAFCGNRLHRIPHTLGLIFTIFLIEAFSDRILM